MSSKDQKEKKKEEKKGDLGALEEDDDFEEFPAEGTDSLKSFKLHVNQRMSQNKRAPPLINLLYCKRDLKFIKMLWSTRCFKKSLFLCFRLEREGRNTRRRANLGRRLG